MKWSALVLTGILSGLTLGQSVGGDTCSQYLRPFPEGGQANGAVVALTQVGAFGQGSGPIEYWEAGGSVATSTHQGTAGALISLFIAPPATGLLVVGGQSLDIDLLGGAAVAAYDGLGILGPSDGTAVGPNGTFTIAYPVGAGITGMIASIQGANIDPAAPLGISLTARNDVGWQDVSSSGGTPEMPPIILNAGTVPVLPAAPNTPNKCASFGAAFAINGPTSAQYPFPRDAICPNNGVVGTRHSAVGVNFDATAAGATSAMVNNIPVVVELVRPDEIIFQLTAAHEPNIGGVLVVTSTGGVYTPPADQTESWVWAMPSFLPNEGGMGIGYGAGGNGAASGAFSAAGGLQGGTGTKDVQGQLDGWDATSAPAPTGTPMRIFCAQYDPVSGQILGNCSGLPSTPAAQCYVTANEAWTQQPFANAINCWNDTYLHGTIDIGGAPLLGPAQAPGWALFDQDDGGPGVTSFKGMSQIPTSATNPALDDDTPWMATGSGEWFVVDDFGNAPIAGNPSAWPYDYVILAYW